MTHAMLTFVAPLAVGKVSDCEKAIDKLGNPATPSVRTALALRPGEMNGVHFASLHAIRSCDGTRGQIVFEFSADGTDDEASKRIFAALEPMFRPVFMMSSDWSDGADFASFMKAHQVNTDNGLSGNPGIPFAGTPFHSVGRILFEQKLGRFCAEKVERQDHDMAAFARLEQVRAAVAADPELKKALEPASADPPFDGSLGGVIGAGLSQFTANYLWPLIALWLLASAVYGLVCAWPVPGFWMKIWTFVFASVGALWTGFWILLLVVVVAAVVIYLSLRKLEGTDSTEPHSPPRTTNQQMFERENVLAQNHMISITHRKPGWVRWFTSRFAFWVVGLAATKYFKPGYLSDIGTIHFARWVTVPETGDVLFMSNYGGSWESYLEDFITKAHEGLTAVWSNTVGFPKTENLFQLGATDGDRFKRFARHSMIPTRFWYSAYPDVTTDNIRANADIRAGLSGVMTEDEAINWLSLFGSAARPAAKLVSQDIQSLIFGGLGFLPFGVAMICELPENKERAKAWLKAVRGHIAFNDGRRLKEEAVFTLALSWRGLTRVGLPEYAGPTFPFAFVEGMTVESRSRILGDVGDNSPDHWRWGKTAPDAVVLIYGRTADSIEKLRQRLMDICRECEAPEPHEVRFDPVTDDKTEPFGFIDGVSQPVIRGTYKSLRNADPIHIVEPGEMVLGYPDNRGYIPPSPTLEPNSDPGNKLPLLNAPNDFSRNVADATRDVGFNGSFLVIRELEQDVDGFWKYCQDEADRLRDRLPAPYHVSTEFIGAKLIGRWKDGSSLVREPYESATAHRQKLTELDRHSKQIGAAISRNNLTAESVDRNLSRPETNPSYGHAIAPASKGADPKNRPIRPDNDFLFGAEDPQALRCPFGAHIRRANPRDSLSPGNADQVSISNRHRITRIGRHYVPQPGQNRGLFFMCFCADIERQFEFLQQTWLRSSSFHGLSCEKDPVLSDAEKGVCGYTVPSPEGPIGLSALPRFVTTKGGGYFFLPGRRLIDYLVDNL
jgi:deferrochelatase/peroxidase EfeB